MTLTRLATWGAVPGLLALLLVAQADRFQSTTSATYDEPLYLDRAHQVYRSGSFDGFIRPMIPPVPILVMGLPLVLTTDGPAPPDSPAWRRQLRTLRLANTCLFGVPLIWLVYGWASARNGWVVGALVAAFAALSPNVVAHTAVATMEAAAAVSYAAATLALCRYAAHPTGGRFAAMATALGVAISCKQSAVCLALIAALPACLAGRGQDPTAPRTRRVARAALRWAGLTAVVLAWAFAVNWALYGLTVAPLLKPGLTHPTFVNLLGDSPAAERLKHWLETVPIPASVDTFLGQVAHGIRGHETYVLGRHTWFAPRYYFPVAVGCKCTPAELILVASVLLYLSVRWRSWLNDPSARTVVLAAGVFLAACLTSRLATGVRYLAPVYPLLMVLAADMAGWLRRAAPRAAAAALVLPALQVVAAVSISPHYMSYFNSLVGGPADGHKYLGDSNLDWGQDLAGVPAEVERLGGRRLCLAYFGAADPRAYGVRAVDWREQGEAAVSGCDLVAVSVSLIQGFEYGPGVFDDFSRLTPVGRVGYGVRIFDLTDPAVRSALARARARYVPPPETGQGRPVHAPSPEP